MIKISHIFLILSLVSLTTAYPGWKYSQVDPSRILAGNCPAGEVELNGTCIASDLDITQLTSTVSVFKANSFQMNYGFPVADEIHIYLEIQKKGFISIGFGSMSDGDMHLVSIDGDKIKLEDSNSSGFSTPDTGEQQDLTLLGYEVTNSSLKVKYSRKLDTQDSNDKVLKKGENIQLIAMYSDSSSVTQHSLDQRVSVSITLEENQSATAKLEGESDIHKMHTLGLLILWGIAADVGIVVAVHFKTHWWYVWVHATIFFVVDFYTIIIVILKIDENKDQLKDIDNDTVHSHFIMGIIFIIFLVVQHAFGAVLKMKGMEKIGLHSYLGISKKIHLSLGIFMYVFAKIMIMTGEYGQYKLQGDDDAYITTGIIFIIIGFVIQFISILAYIFRQRNAKKYVLLKVQNSPTTEYQTSDPLLEQLVNAGESLQTIQEKLGKDTIYAIYDNKILNLTKFYHPGGQYILTQVNGREVERCFFGGYSLEGDKRAPYVHTQTAEQYMYENVIGLIHQTEKINVLNQYSNGSDSWKIENKFDITPTTSKFDFQSPNYKFKNYLSGIEWIGKFFQVQAEGNEKRRLYTTVMSMTNDNIKFRKDLVEYALSDFSTSQPEKMPEFSNSLPLYIKKYSPQNQTLSSVIHQAKESNQQFSVKGPQGVGLKLNEKSQGTYVMVTGGTGILPLLDLLNVYLQKTIYEAAKQSKGEDFAKSNIDIHGQQLDKYLNDVQIHMYSAFIEEAEFLGRDIIENIIKVQNKFGLKGLQFTAKFQKAPQTLDGINIVKTSFNKAFFSNHKDSWGSQLQKIWVCGPPGLNAGVKSSLQEYSSTNQIEFV